jgi:predicted Zn-dependent protease
VLTREEAKRVIDRAVSASKADEVHVEIQSEQTAHLRFARNLPNTSGTFEDRSVSITSTFGRRSGTYTVNQLDDASIDRAVAKSEEMARLAPEDPEFLAGIGPQAYADVAAGFRQELQAGLREGASAQLAEGVGTCLDAARDRGLVTAGFATASANANAIGNSRGLFGYDRNTSAHFSQTVRTADAKGSGWAASTGRALGDINFLANSTIAIDKAVRSKDPKPLAPGKYVTILEPACVADLVTRFMGGMDARAADEGRSYFSNAKGGNRLGEKLFPDGVTISSDPEDSKAPGLPWGEDGVPQKRRPWVGKGSVENLVYSRFWAQKNGREAVPRPSNVLMAGGSGTTEDLIKDTKRGVLITSLWYIRGVDPKTMLFTGLTRDGVFWIENGEIVHPVTNFRWNDSPVRVLKNIEAMAATQLVSTRESSANTIVVPALRVREFELSSVSDAV